MTVPPGAPGLAQRLRVAWWRGRLLARARMAGRALEAIRPPAACIPEGAVPVFCVVRNEALRLPGFLAHHRALGAGPFLIIDNGSTDGTGELLAAEPDVSLWRSSASYRGSRFGMDWIGWLLGRYGVGRWCLVLDADERLIYPGHEDRALPELVRWLERRGAEAMGAMLLDLYPRGPILARPTDGILDPLAHLRWFDPDPGLEVPRPALRHVMRRGGPRARVLLGGDRRRAPVLTKLPLVRWRRGFAWASSTHAALPPRLNTAYHDPALPTGVLLHLKLLPDVGARTREDMRRRQHFVDPDAHADYHARILANPDFHDPAISVRLSGWRQLVGLGLMRTGAWMAPPAGTGGRGD